VSTLLEAYERVVHPTVLAQIRLLGRKLEGASVVHVNSTRSGGGVAEILERFVPLMGELGIRVRWEVISGSDDFYAVTKRMHNAIQGSGKALSDAMKRTYTETNEANAKTLRSTLEEADFVFIHDPQPAALLRMCPGRRGKWIWRCHIDSGRPERRVWGFLRDWIEPYDASVFSLAEYAQPLSHPEYIVPPSIDPLSEKNKDLADVEIRRVLISFGIDPDRPVALQVSRFDRFKDPVGVIESYRLCRRSMDLQLVLAGGEASDDPEGSAVLEEVREAAAGDPDIHILTLPADAHATINALQRGADIVIQKSTKEGFGLTVAEGMWKHRPVIGGDTGGIRIQVTDRVTGFRVRTPEGAALRMRYLIRHPKEARAMGENAYAFVREHFLITRQLRNELSIMVALGAGRTEQFEVFL
jgi:trehalose synthase